MATADVDWTRPSTQGAWDQDAAWNADQGKGNNATCQYDNETIRKKGCWYNFSKNISSMWATRQMTGGKDDREVYVRTTLRELVIYIIFLIILCILTFGMTSPTMYYYTKVLSDLFLDAPFPDTRNTFRGATQVMDFWRFTQNVMLDGLYWEYWYDTAPSLTGDDDRNILYENRMLGVPRLVMVKVTNTSCSVPEDFHKVIRQCYAIYSISAEDTAPFGNGTGTAWTYTDAETLGGSSHWGKIATYGGGGYYQNLGTNRSQSEDILAELRRELWIQRGTRAVFIDFTVYNANINLFCVIKLVFEFPATGGVIPSWSFRTVKLLRYVTPLDHFVLACEFIFIFFIIYYIVEEALEIRLLKWRYFKSMWNILDIVVIVISLVCIGFSVFCTFTIKDKLEELLSDPNTFANFEFLGYWQTQFNSAVAVCVFFAWFKLFKYISFNKTMTQLSSTLSRCAKDVGGFTIMFFIVFFAFAQLGYLLFGTQVRDFSSFINAVFTLLRTILGDFNFHEIEDANRVLGPLFFLSYVFFVFFVLLNMFLAIINDTYSEVKAEIANQRNEFELTDYFRRGYNNMLGKVGRRDKLIDIENAVKLAQATDGFLTFEDVRKNLKQCNFSDQEIDFLFSNCDQNGDEKLSGDEVKDLLHRLQSPEDMKNLPKKESQRSAKDSSEAETRPVSASSYNNIPSVSLEEFDVLQRRVDRVEHSIGSIVSKIDAVLVKLDTMEKSRQKRRETMRSMLDTITEDNLDEKARRKQMEKLVREEMHKLDDHRPNTGNPN